MLKSILNYIYHTDESLPECINYGDKYRMHFDESCKCYDKLKETFNKEEDKLLEELIDNQTEMECISSETNFKEGIKFGIRFILECMSD